MTCPTPVPRRRRAGIGVTRWTCCSVGGRRERARRWLAPAEQAPTAAAASADRPGHGPAVAALPAPVPGAVVAGDRAGPRGAAGPAARRAVHRRGGPAARARRRLGLVRLLDWLAEHPGDTWQQRWLVSGADAMGNAAVVAPAAGLGAATQPARRGVDLEQPAGLRAAAHRRRRDPPEPGLGADPARPAEPGRGHGPSPGPPRFRRAVSAVCCVPGGTDDEDCGAAPRGDHPRGQGRNPARDHRRGLPGAVAGHRRPVAAREQGDGVLPAAPRDGRVLPGRTLDVPGVRHHRSAQPGPADRPLRHHLPPGPRRPRRLPGRTPADARPHHPAGSGVQPGRAVLAGPGTPPPRHLLAATCRPRSPRPGSSAS